MRVVFSREAREDLAGIRQYIAIDSQRHALRVVHDLRRSCSLLGELPLRSPVVRQIRGKAIRRRTWTSYSIFYQVEDRTVTILRILHAARDYDHALFSGDET